MKSDDRQYFLELAKDLGLFTAGIFTGPFIDFALLMKKHAPILHKKISQKINEKIEFYKEVR
ncbi:MAG: hypothetical protein ACP5TO_08025 [Thermoplasmata archaeon]